MTWKSPYKNYIVVVIISIIVILCSSKRSKLEQSPREYSIQPIHLRPRNIHYIYNAVSSSISPSSSSWVTNNEPRLIEYCSTRSTTLSLATSLPASFTLLSLRRPHRLVAPVDPFNRRTTLPYLAITVIIHPSRKTDSQPSDDDAEFLLSELTTLVRPHHRFDPWNSDWVKWLSSGERMKMGCFWTTSRIAWKYIQPSREYVNRIRSKLCLPYDDNDSHLTLSLFRHRRLQPLSP